MAVDIEKVALTVDKNDFAVKKIVGFRLRSRDTKSLKVGGDIHGLKLKFTDFFEGERQLGNYSKNFLKTDRMRNASTVFFNRLDLCLEPVFLFFEGLQC